MIGIPGLSAVLAFCAFLLLFPPAAVPGTPVSPPDSGRSVFLVGEELIYNVSYATVNLGQVRIRILEKKTEQGRTVYAAQANIDSYKGVPFVDLHAIFDNLIDERIHSAWFRSKVDGDHGWDTVSYSYDYPNKRLFVLNRPAPGDGKSFNDTLAIESFYQDGLSLFFFARQEVLNRRQVTVPTVVNEKKGTTSFDFLAERMDEEIDAVDYPVDVVYFKGEAGFVGIFGLTGDFEGWFSNDDARVPVLAKMKVLIGSVRIELMKWKRDGWSPPRYRKEGGQ